MGPVLSRRHTLREFHVTDDTTKCPTPVPLAWVRLEPGAWRLGPVAGVTLTPCKRWACDHCGRGKRAEALKLIRRVVEVGAGWDPRQPARLLTLTRPRDKPARLDNRGDCLAASDDVRELIRSWRRHGRTLEYVRVFERTRRGRIHVHLLTWGHYLTKCTDSGRRRRGLPTTADIKATWKAAEAGSLLTQSARSVVSPADSSPCYCTEARPCIQRLAWAHGWGWVDVRAVRSPKMAAAYVAKYLGKSTTEDWPRHARRVSYSRDAAGGLTLGAIHAAWCAEVRGRLDEENVTDGSRIFERTWVGIVARPPPRAPPLAAPGRWYSYTTGELLAIPA